MSNYKSLRPTRVYVLGNIYAVRWVEYIQDGELLGECDPDRNEITISEHQHPQCELNTVLHEMLHAAYPISRFGEGKHDEESLVTRTADLMTTLLLNNLHLQDYIQAIHEATMVALKEAA